MADITITLPYNKPDGSSIPVTFSVPKEKLKFEGTKVVGGDEDYVKKAAQMAFEARYPHEAGRSPATPDKQHLPPPQGMPEIKSYKGMPIVPPDNRGALERFGSGLKQGALGIATTLGGGSSINEEQAQELSKPIWKRQPVDPTTLPVVSDINRVVTGDIAGEVGNLLPYAVAGGASSPKIRSMPGGFVDAIKRNPPTPQKFGPAGIMGAGAATAWQLAHGHPITSGPVYGGLALGSAAEAAIDATATGVKGALRTASTKPLIQPGLLDPTPIPQPNYLSKQTPFNDSARPFSPYTPQPSAAPPTGLQTIPPETGFNNFTPPTRPDIVMPPPAVAGGGPQQPALQASPRVFNMPGTDVGPAIQPDPGNWTFGGGHQPQPTVTYPPKALAPPQTGPQYTPEGAIMMPPAETPGRAVVRPIRPEAPVDNTPALTPEEVGQKLTPKVRQDAMRGQGSEQPQASAEQVDKQLDPQEPKKDTTNKVVVMKPGKKLTWSKLQEFAIKRKQFTTDQVQEQFGATREEAEQVLNEIAEEGMVHRAGSTWKEGKAPEKPVAEAKPTETKPAKAKTAKEDITAEQPKPAEAKTSSESDKDAASKGAQSLLDRILNKKEEPKPDAVTSVADDIEDKRFDLDYINNQLKEGNVLTDKQYKRKIELEKELKAYDKIQGEKAKEAKPAENSITSPDLEAHKVSHDELYEIANTLGIKATPLARELMSRGFDVEPSKFGRGTYGVERLGQGKRGAAGIRDSTAGNLFDDIGERKLKNLLELMGKRIKEK